MRAEIRRFHSPDVDLETYQPSSREDLGLLLQMHISPLGQPGDESFDILVCSSSWLEREVGKRGAIFGRHYLIVSEWDFEAIKTEVTNAVAACEAPSWTELAELIGRIGRWEFEDYLDSRPSDQ